MHLSKMVHGKFRPNTVTGSLSFLDVFHDTCGSGELLLWGQLIALFEVGCTVQLEEGGSLGLLVVSAHPEQEF